MASDFERLSAALAGRMQELGVGPADPRVAPLVTQLQALMRAHLAQSAGGSNVVMLPTSGAPATATGPSTQSCFRDLSLDLAVLLRAYLDTCPPQAFTQAPALSQSEEGRRILDLPPSDRVRIAVAVYDDWSSAPWGGPDGAGLRRVVSDLLRGKLRFADGDAIALVAAATREGFTYAGYSPNQAVLSMLERHVADHGVSADLRRALEHLRTAMKARGAEDNAQGRKLLSGVERLLAHHDGTAGVAPVFQPKPDAWGAAAEARLATLSPDAQARLGPLMLLAGKGGTSAKPTKGWLRNAEQALAGDDRAEVGERLLDLVECHEPGAAIALENQETLRGLLWLAAMAAPDVAARRLEAFAQKCLTFSAAHFAYLSLVLGNASIHAFVLMPGTTGVASLSRLRRRLKRPGEIKTVDKALSALAEARGLTAGELEEIALPDYGFASDGRLETAVGPATAVLEITAANTVKTSWRGPNGAPLKGPPAEVKASHADALKLLKARAKEIAETLKAQCARLERLYLDERDWPLELWSTRYLKEPLVARMARALIWSFKLGDRWMAGLPGGGSLADGIFDASGARLDLAAGDVRVRLWHPMQSDASHVLAWRRRLASLGVTQPFKQAHREIYLLTAAERATQTYSNRFAGHIVQQHQFRALCQARGWSCPAYGSWDPGNGRPTKRLPRLQVEFWVDPIEDSLDEQRFQFLQLSTDQVRFASHDGELVALEQVPPVAFSELMRDVDLFVSVASIGNDPSWGDRGAGNYGEYWNAAAFGPLSETAKTRHAVLEDLLPGLNIAAQCRLEERFLVVVGKLRTYRIHLGSSNVRMEPNDQYLCIVQDHQNAGARVRLPFEGDTMLSLILSKAFLLADDDRIKDPAILSQIKMA
jgi:Domain of unknown function (DUF4132)